LRTLNTRELRRWLDEAIKANRSVKSARKNRRPESSRACLTVSHRGRLIDELRAEPALAARYAEAAAENDSRLSKIALRTLASARQPFDRRLHQRRVTE
jgi:hypothetical protein